MAARRTGEERVNLEIPPQVEKVLQGGKVLQVALTRAITTYVTRDVGPRVNSLEISMTFRLRDFVRKNPPVFLGSKVRKVPQDFIDNVYKVLSPMGYALSLVFNPMNEKSRFVTGVTNLVKEECHTTMFHSDMNLSRLMMYAQSIKESKLSRISKKLKSGGSNDQNQLKFKKRAPNHDGPSSPKEEAYRKCLVFTVNCFGSGKEGHKVRDCPSILDGGKEGKKVPSSVLEGDVPS
ncbi:hypothetical protein EJD97_012814 [Solanum chilense]|uniref:CCHC-type domain-containing protein n=1 Tax=Solanum chilense TaxID=4083 RepID=A0A6N2C8C8_SOLCI|nr:hypothetical protein EJD97_012814 [Solanum chilense]